MSRRLDSAARTFLVERPGGAPIPVPVRRSARARQLLLSVDPATGPELVLPRWVSLAEGQAFLDGRRDWLLGRVAAMPGRIAFADGAAVPFLGACLTVRHLPARRGGAWREGDVLNVAGDARHLARRVRDWLAAQARVRAATIAAEKAALLGLDAPRIAVRDPRRQWGSCSAGGTLALSWRLALAPEPVIDYVVAHEVAHLKEMNHGPRFWALVARLTPHMATAKIWLRRHGAALLAYG